MNELIKNRINESINISNIILNDEIIINHVINISNKIIETLKKGNKLVLCGNGGSAADALHFASEMIGRFQLDRNAWPAIVLNADAATMTSISNDYSYDKVFSRQAEAFVKPGDIFIGISTSGNSQNVIEAAKAANKIGAYTFTLTGNDGGNLKKVTDLAIIVPSNNAARIQETHKLLIHIICELVEKELTIK